MLIDEHKSIMNELNSETIEPARRLELVTKLSDDYTLTQAEVTTTKDTLTSVEKERNHFASLSQKLWLENSATLTDASNKDSKTKDKIEHQAKRSFNDLMSKF